MARRQQSLVDVDMSEDIDKVFESDEPRGDSDTDVSSVEDVETLTVTSAATLAPILTSRTRSSSSVGLSIPQNITNAGWRSSSKASLTLKITKRGQKCSSTP
ncbi:chromosome condensation protein [Metarhizium robertsii ARSEF 23]|uniref:Chromosome condensation protein n=1 Tax=Metarhizium robertsii (strain ARSEF 23 / ATCC MYA-3075) TaxID=655844 RepID=A0A0B2XEW1_METRA|nr:chromosome condensation protein [Metarhizium robertsii ARSEF 23]KHO11280.1 chromosome condensation protein [Metarhizium robertsii ARSEF 23]